MKTIQYKQTSITISCDGGFSTNDNTIRYSITSALADAEELKILFPDKQFSLIDNTLTFSGSASVSNMWDLISTVAIEAEDLGLTVINAIIQWSTNIIYDMNLLNINTSDWTIIE